MILSGTEIGRTDTWLLCIESMNDAVIDGFIKRSIFPAAITTSICRGEQAFSERVSTVFRSPYTVPPVKTMIEYDSLKGGGG
jgi:hypothetical protein